MVARVEVPQRQRFSGPKATSSVMTKSLRAVVLKLEQQNHLEDLLK